MTTLQGKVAAVTGAGSGIGRALVVELVARGAHVAASDVDERGLRETAELARGETKVTTHRVDVRDRHAVERYAADVKAEHGGADVIINNAGVAVRASIAEISYEDFAFVLDVNLWGVVYGTKAFLPLFEERGAGHIVNISSVNGMVPFTKNSPYNVSKYGVLGFSETLMQEYRDRPIRTTVVHPGGIRTNIVRNARHAVPGEAETFDRIAMTSPAQAAKVILNGVEKNRERVYVG
ncbi:MAG TPA: SDR family oxidoreductase, partial [Polyangiales bacterium]|nr:SDR family oxidoreductase [Polyangiales bacterium]